MPRIKSLKPKIKVKEVKSKVKVTAVSKGVDSDEELEEELESTPSRSMERMPVSQSRSSGVLEMSHDTQRVSPQPARAASETPREDVRYEARASDYVARIQGENSTYATRRYETPLAERAPLGRTAPIISQERTTISDRRTGATPMTDRNLAPERLEDNKYHEAPAAPKRKMPWEK